MKVCVFRAILGQHPPVCAHLGWGEVGGEQGGLRGVLGGQSRADARGGDAAADGGPVGGAAHLLLQPVGVVAHPVVPEPLPRYHLPRLRIRDHEGEHCTQEILTVRRFYRPGGFKSQEILTVRRTRGCDDAEMSLSGRGSRLATCVFSDDVLMW